MNLAVIVDEIQSLDHALAARAISAVNASLSIRNWLIGAYIVEFEQNGEERAAYGEKLIPELAERLKAAKIKGLDSANLKRCRQFYQIYPAISATLSRQFSNLLPASYLEKSATLSHLLNAPKESGSLLKTTKTCQTPFDQYALGGMDENLFVSQYQIQLPSPEELEIFLSRQQNTLS
ncbi:MAG: DUF1016 N-terminal domain-containing protein [Chthoniobacterales bacterium]